LLVGLSEIELKGVAPPLPAAVVGRGIGRLLRREGE
jgi:hypothetical protein